MPISINSYEHPRNLKLLATLGIVDADTDQGDVFLRWGALLDETVVNSKFICSGKDLYTIVGEMSPAERTAMRDRICGVSVLSPR